MNGIFSIIGVVVVVLVVLGYFGFRYDRRSGSVPPRRSRACLGPSDRRAA